MVTVPVFEERLHRIDTAISLSTAEMTALDHRLMLGQARLAAIETRLSEMAELREVLTILAEEKISDLNSRLLRRDSDFSPNGDLAHTLREQLRELKREVEEENGYGLNANLLGGIGYNVQTGASRPTKVERQLKAAPIISKLEQQIEVLDSTDRYFALLMQFLRK